MDNSLIIVIEFVILMIAVSLSRKQTKQALSKLSNTNRQKVKDLTGNGVNQIIPILILVILFFMVKPYFTEGSELVNYSFAAVLLLYLMVNGALLYLKLKKAGLPDMFTKLYIQATAILYVGAAIFCYLAVTNPL